MGYGIDREDRDQGFIDVLFEMGDFLGIPFSFLVLHFKKAWGVA